jgi:diguanylate cyclase (GGDEF)-like protein/PAS domain S-box-containing protein
MDVESGRSDETRAGIAMPALEPLPPGLAELLLAHSSDALLWYGLDGSIIWASPALERAFGWKPCEVVGTPFRLAPADDQEKTRAEVLAAMERGDDRVTVRSRARFADGSVGWADTAAAFVRDAEGAVIGSVASIRDVTAEVEAEERYRLLAENATDMVFIRDVDGNVTWASPSTRAVLGVTPEELVGTNTMDYVHPDEQPVARAVRAQVASGEAARGVVARIRRADGGYRYMFLVSHPVTDAAGTVTGAVGGMKDVDELVRARMQVEHERALLRASSDSMLDPQVLLEAVRDASGQLVDFTYVALNRAACEYFDRPLPGILGASLLATLPGLAESELFALEAVAIDPGEPYRLTGFRYHNEVLGEERDYDICCVLAGPDLLSLTWSDVTDRLEEVRRLEESEQRYRLLAENVSDVVVHVRDGLVAWVSPSVERVFGAPPYAWIGRPMVEFIHPDDLEQVVRDIATLTPDATVIARQRIRGVDDTYHWVESNSRVYLDDAGAEDGFLASLRVVDDLVASEIELARRARIDELTGLLNRAEALARLGDIMVQGRRRGDHVSVLFCDVDWFKNVNDKYGHAAGDEVLRVTAERISASIRKDDVAARFGGDEILVVLTGIHDREEALGVAEKVRRVCCEAIDMPEAVIQVTVSIGVAFASAGEPVDDVIADADRAMYRAKQTGRDRVVVL